MSLCLLVALGSGCTTVTALQTASTVDPGMFRVSAQASVSPYCTVTASPINRCVVLPNGLPLPELRGALRYGFAPAWDAGATVHASAVVPTGVLLGLGADAKRELVSLVDSGDHRHVFSLSLGADASYILALRPDGTARTAGVDLDVPVAGWYGVEYLNWQWVVSPRFVERFSFFDANADNDVDLFATSRVGLTLSAIRQGPFKLGVSLDYFAPTSDVASGLWTVSVGGLWDLMTAKPAAPAPAPEAPAASPPPE